MNNVKRQRTTVEIFNESGLRLPLNHKEMQAVIRFLLSHFQISSYELHLIFTDDEALRRMKKEYFGEAVYTDIISFTMECCEDYVEGELYISLPRIRENANEYHVSIRQECVRIIIHGFLHLLGFDDAGDKEREAMKRTEDQFLRECGYA
jgi:probable rRNA maturation factor